ncbi:hypothetical protein SDC9_89387 [bioreactor metagenome]|uniref:Uncharacterized protein n=1 Tax=bioreactor metagenome TaxID=1076179 RepID=A0A644ZQR7_9ZZZZ
MQRRIVGAEIGVFAVRAVRLVGREIEAVAEHLVGISAIFGQPFKKAVVNRVNNRQRPVVELGQQMKTIFFKPGDIGPGEKGFGRIDQLDVFVENPG